MLIHPFHSSLNQLISGNFLCRSLLLSTAWFLCDLSMNQALAKVTPDTTVKEHSESIDEKHSDSDKYSDKKETSEEDKAKEEKARDEAFKPVYSKDMYRVGYL